MPKNHTKRNICLFSLYLLLWLASVSLEMQISGPPNPSIFNALPQEILLVINTSYIFILPLLAFATINYTVTKNLIRKTLFFASALVCTLIYEWNFFLLVYHFREKHIFDWNFFWFYRWDAVVAVFKVFGLYSWLFFVLLPLSVFLVLLLNTTTVKSFNDKISSSKKFYQLAGLIIFINILSLLFSPAQLKGETINFVDKNFGNNQKIKNFYTDAFYNYLDRQAKNNYDYSPAATDNPFGQNIFFIHLESVNSFLVDSQTTPNLISHAEEGVFFPKFYNNSVQTIRAEENIICGLPPSPKNNLVNILSTQKLNELKCLPQVLKQLGYKTLFFKDDTLKFSNTGEFMKGIGFDELHYDDIMQPGDPISNWGYREDIFYQRVIEYLQKNYPGQKLFIYIATSSTNHLPFEVHDSRYSNLVPYPEPKTFREHITNTTFIQDAYLGKMLDKTAKDYRPNSSFFIFGDHAWPIGLHPGNIFNELNGYEENFLTSFLFLPPQNSKNIFQTNKTVATRYSEMDILPTMLEILNIKNSILLGNSFSAEILKQPSKISERKNNIVSIQPYNGSLISVINCPDKYLFDVMNDKLFLFDLIKDPLEENPKELDSPANHLELITDFFSFK